MKFLNWSWVKHFGGGEESIFSKKQEIETFGENEYKYGLIPYQSVTKRGEIFSKNPDAETMLDVGLRGSLKGISSQRWFGTTFGITERHNNAMLHWIELT